MLRSRTVFSGPALKQQRFKVAIQKHWGCNQKHSIQRNKVTTQIHSLTQPIKKQTLLYVCYVCCSREGLQFSLTEVRILAHKILKPNLLSSPFFHWKPVQVVCLGILVLYASDWISFLHSGNPLLARVLMRLTKSASFSSGRIGLQPETMFVPLDISLCQFIFFIPVLLFSAIGFWNRIRPIIISLLAS